MNIQIIVRAFFRPLVLIGIFFVAIMLLTAAFLILDATRPEMTPADPGTAVIHMIAAPTETTVPAMPAPSLSPTPPLVENGLFIGGSVEITGTGGDGLRLRYTAGLEGKVRLLGSEGEIFTVVDGPQKADGYTWWYLENPQDSARRGWAVADFLRPAQTP